MNAGLGDLAIGSVLEDRYEILSLLGRGGYGLVYKARQLNTGQLVAVKLLLVDKVGGARHQTEIARFQREMKLIGQIRHPNVVRLIDSGQLDDGRLFIVLEYIEGETLAAILQRGPLPVRQAHRVLHQVLEALAGAHANGVIHRDLKPHNIMVTDPGPRCNAVVVDFGVSFVAEEARDADYRTLTGRDEVAGTPGYMAPEQLIMGDVSEAVDVYAWGLCAIEAMSGLPAIIETSLVKLVLRYGSARPVEIPDVLAASPFGPLLARATAIDPEQRYATVEEVLADLEAIDLRDPEVDALDAAVGALSDTASGAAAPAVWESTIDSVPVMVREAVAASPSSEPAAPGASPLEVVARSTRTAAPADSPLHTPRPPTRAARPAAREDSAVPAEPTPIPSVPAASASQPARLHVQRAPGLERTLLFGVALVAIGVMLVLLLARNGGSGDTPPATAVTLDVPAGGSPGGDPAGAPPSAWLPERDAVSLGTVRVPAGSFIMGCNQSVDPTCLEDQRPAHRVELDSFEVDVTEVTVSAYAHCVRADVCDAPALYEPGRNPGCNWGHPDRADHPVNCVTWYQAQLFCEWLGKRLPTEAEWERAARGDDGRLYPWGDQPPDCDLAVFSSGSHGCAHTTTESVGNRPLGVSPYGIHNLAGNVSEWISDWYDDAYYARSSTRNPTGPPGGTERAQRGADFNDSPDELNLTARESKRPWEVDDDLGFRCVRSVD